MNENPRLQPTTTFPIPMLKITLISVEILALFGCLTSVTSDHCVVSANREIAKLRMRYGTKHVHAGYSPATFGYQRRFFYDLCGYRLCMSGDLVVR